MAEKIARWILFTVLAAVIPLGITGLTRQTKNLACDLQSLLSTGELILISATICVAAIGELFGIGRRFPIIQILTGGCCLLLLVGAALYYASLFVSPVPGPNIDASVVTRVSCWVYGASVVLGTGCIILSEV
jgi:hypothetical protein